MKMPAASRPMNLRWPVSVSQVESIQRERKRVAVERALQSPFLKKRIPKGRSRRSGTASRSSPRKSCVRSRPSASTTSSASSRAPRRSSTGARAAPPAAALLPALGRGHAARLARLRARLGADRRHADDCAHISFPLGVHPVAHLYARAAINRGIGTVWCGAGTNTPSEVQLELIDHLKPTIWLGMASWAAPRESRRSEGFDLKFHGEEDHRGRRAALPVKDRSWRTPGARRCSTTSA